MHIHDAHKSFFSGISTLKVHQEVFSAICFDQFLNPVTLYIQYFSMYMHEFNGWLHVFDFFVRFLCSTLELDFA